jgi:hypothetical protein
MRLIALLVIMLTTIGVSAQLENEFQPDSIYFNRKVKTIYVYENSRRDLSRIIQLNDKGFRIRITYYSASYNKKTRKAKAIERLTLFKYDSQMRLIQIIDSFGYSSGINNEYFYYRQNGMLDSSKDFQTRFQTPVSETYYYTNPRRSLIIKRNGTSIIYYMTTEYDMDFYEKKSYGYNVESKLKDGFTVNGNDTLRFQYSDYSDMQTFGDTTVIANTFNSKGQLTTSAVNQIFMTNRTFACKLSYSYYSTGLLKSILGYVPEFFKYEFYE